MVNDPVTGSVGTGSPNAEVKPPTVKLTSSSTVVALAAVAPTASAAPRQQAEIRPMIYPPYAGVEGQQNDSSIRCDPRNRYPLPPTTVRGPQPTLNAAIKCYCPKSARVNHVNHAEAVRLRPRPRQGS